MLSISTFLIISGLAVSAATLLSSNQSNESLNKENNTQNINRRKSISEFSYDKIKTVLEYELYGKSTSELNEILKYNNFYTDSDLSHYEVAYKIANTAQYGNRIYPTYLEKKIEDRLNEKYN